MGDIINSLPCHVGIIMDGNGRWATAKGKQRSFGHRAGADNVQKIVKALFEKGVSYISLYAFSTENINRPEKEVKELIKILDKGLNELTKSAVKNKIRLTVSGESDRFGSELKDRIEQCTRLTEQFEKPVLNVCLNYGARQELCHAFNLMLNAGEENITEKTVEKYLYNSFLPPLDLVIRTGGEIRLSNFMLWQAAYAELYFCDTLWPDFCKEDAYAALEWYSTRSRRYGKL